VKTQQFLVTIEPSIHTPIDELEIDEAVCEYFQFPVSGTVKVVELPEPIEPTL